MSKLLAKMRKARTSAVEVDKYKITVIRPTIQQMVALKTAGYSHLDLARDYVVDWASVTEADLVTGGASEPLAFDLEVWREWLADNPEWWTPIGMAVVKAYNAYSDYREDAVKN